MMNDFRHETQTSTSYMFMHGEYAGQAQTWLTLQFMMNDCRHETQTSILHIFMYTEI